MFDDKAQKYRWFLLPSEAADILSGHNVPNFSSQLPFCPPAIRETANLPPFVLEVTKNNGVVYTPVTLNPSETKRHTNFSEKLVENLQKVQCNSNCTDIKANGCDSACNVNSSEEGICSSDSTEREKNKVCNDNSRATSNSTCPLVCATRKRDLQDKTIESPSPKAACSNSKQMKCEKTTKQQLLDNNVGGERSVNGEQNSKLVPAKKSPASKWFSPPKAIFTKFLKVKISYMYMYMYMYMNII